MAGALQRLAVQAGHALHPFEVRGIQRLLRGTAPWIFGPGVQVVQTAGGFRLALDTSDALACTMVYGRYAPELVALLHRLVRPGDRVLDVGAQIGFMAMHLARCVGQSGRVWAFEPDPSALKLLRRSVAENGFAQVHVVPQAVSDRAGALPFYLSPTSGWSTAVRGVAHAATEPIAVQAVRIDDLMRDGTLQGPIRFVKIDVEGFETAALDGMSTLLETDRPIVLTEINPAMLEANGTSAGAVLQRMATHDYRLHRVHKSKSGIRSRQPVIEEIAPSAELPFCDVLCVPRERSLPPLNR